MLTSKQRWRRVPVRQGKGASRRPLSSSSATTTAAAAAAGSGVTEHDATATATVENMHASSKKVRFHSTVRVILVPCVEEIRHLSAQLWWGKGDYLHFRREFLHTLKSKAAAARQQAPVRRSRRFSTRGRA
ncbi:unnamed protein product [Pylaiella littoralis]